MLDKARATMTTRPRPRVLWFYGPTGTGKSHHAHLLAAQTGPYWSASKDLNWFNGYDPMYHKAVVVDDFRQSFCSFDWLLKITDKYPLEVPTKGGFVCWAPELIIITCPWSIEGLYG